MSGHICRVQLKYCTECFLNNEATGEGRLGVVRCYDERDDPGQSRNCAPGHFRDDPVLARNSLLVVGHSSLCGAASG